MIFVTVGTHEQQFNRLIKEIDDLKADNVCDDEFIVQKGYSTYNPSHCTCYDLIPFENVQKYINEARIVITHGGPASFISAISIGKHPVVVPRQKAFGEHVNDHQLIFAKELASMGVPITVVTDISELRNIIINFDKIDRKVKFNSNNKEFNNNLLKNIKNLYNS